MGHWNTSMFGKLMKYNNNVPSKLVNNFCKVYLED